MNSLIDQELLRQRADYTHKYNIKTGRHGWLRLTPAYSVRVVEELMAHTTGRLRVLDPFCGTATSALSAAYHGHDATTTDINPFLVWLGRAKTDHYSDKVISRTLDIANQALRTISEAKSEPQPAPPLYNIERWWSPGALDFLCRLRDAIDLEADASSKEANLLKVAYCRTLIALSNAAFNHQSMSFKSATQASLNIGADYPSQFKGDLHFVLKGACENIEGTARIALHDARALSTLEGEPFDFVVTSPPYANRMSYIRELRPYMYWLHFLMNGREAGEMDWLAIGGTWGIATSRLADWKAQDGAYTSPDLERTLSKVSSPDNQNGALLAAYIRKYCVDIAVHFHELRSVLNPGAELHYIVGNSTFYGELLSIEKIYAHMMEELGFSNIHIRAIRKRNSKKELIEFDVSATWPG
jgi:DNA modification methylase